MTITTPEEYRRALARIAELQGQDEKVDSSKELAHLEAEVARYVSQENKPDASKGRPPLSERTREGR